MASTTAENPLPPLPDVLPVLPLRGTVVFPLTIAPVLVGQARSVQLVEQTLRGDKLVALVMQKDAGRPAEQLDELHRAGTLARIQQAIRSNDGTYRLVLQGLERLRLLDLVQQ